jgi:hypothetical protein
MSARSIAYFALLSLSLLACRVYSQQPAAGDDPTVVGQLEHVGWGLTGTRGRHYVFGGLAMADYTDSSGQRRIMALQHEEQINDERYLYYRELRTGHRWAFAKRVASDGAYGVYFQLAPVNATDDPKWVSFHRARIERAGAGQGTPGIPVSIDAGAPRDCCH